MSNEESTGRCIPIFTNSTTVTAAAQEIARRMDAAWLARKGLHGTVTEDGVIEALCRDGWLRAHLQDVVNAATRNLPAALTDPGSPLSHGQGHGSFLAWLNLEDIEAAPDGCYCDVCRNPCLPVWYDSRDSWVPNCHTRGQVYRDAACLREMEIEHILEIADGSDIEAYNRCADDLRTTERSVS